MYGYDRVFELWTNTLLEKTDVLVRCLSDCSVLFRNWTVHLADVPSVLRLTNCGTWSENCPAGEKHITTETHFSSLHTQKVRHSP